MLVIVTFITMLNICFSYTVRDLRVLLGQNIDLSNESISEVLLSELELFSQSLSKLGYKSIYDKYNKLKTQFSDYNNKLITTAHKVYNEFIERKSVEDIKKGLAELNIIEYNVNKILFEIEQQYSLIKNLEEQDKNNTNIKNRKLINLDRLIDVTYIGELGSNLRSFILDKNGNEKFTIIKPFGISYNRIKRAEEKSDWLYVSADKNCKVISIWRGVVVNVDKFNTKTNDKDLGTIYKVIITIKHSDYLYTQYIFTGDAVVKVGDNLEESSIIGVIKQDKSEAGLRIKLDDSYINPILVYGKKGLEKFYLWKINNPDKFIPSTDIVVTYDVSNDSVNSVRSKYEYEKKVINNKIVNNKPKYLPKNAVEVKLPPNYVPPINDYTVSGEVYLGSN